MTRKNKNTYIHLQGPIYLYTSSLANKIYVIKYRIFCLLIVIYNKTTRHGPERNVQFMK